MNIQVAGSGCPTCKQLFEMTKQAVSEMKMTESVEYLSGAEGIQKIVERGAMSSPILIVDDKIVMIGFTPNIEKVKKAIVNADAK